MHGVSPSFAWNVDSPQSIEICDEALPRCPECGKLPPGRKKSESFRELLGRKLSYKRSSGSAKSNQSRSREARGRTKGREEASWKMQVARGGERITFDFCHIHFTFTFTQSIELDC